MSDTFDGVVVEYFDINHEITKAKQQELEDNDIAFQMDDSSGEDDRNMYDMLEAHEISEAGRMSERR